MNARDRVIAALRRQPADRAPIFMWFHPSTARRLAILLEIAPGDVPEAMGNDILQTWVNNNFAMEGIVHQNDGEWHEDEWGIRWTKCGEFNQATRFPLQKAAPDDLLKYQFPIDHMETLLARMAPVAARRAEFFIGVDVSPCVFEMYWRLRGMEQALLDMAFHPEQSGLMFARCADFAALLSAAACERFAVDWLWTGDDVAGQHGMIMAPDQWRNFIKPHLRRVVEEGRRRGLPVAYHCCGAVRAIIPDLIEIGIGILNPLQCNCPGMDPLELKREYGRDLAFMGGVDTQGILPQGSADAVYRATMRLLEGMTSDGGGYILAASHTIPPETPDENIFAMYAAAGLPRAAICDRAADIRRRTPAQNPRQ